jgi:hypothetical protein
VSFYLGLDSERLLDLLPVHLEGYKNARVFGMNHTIYQSAGAMRSPLHLGSVAVQ